MLWSRQAFSHNGPKRGDTVREDTPGVGDVAVGLEETGELLVCDICGMGCTRRQDVGSIRRAETDGTDREEG